MASLRGISKRVNLLQRRVYPSCGYHRFGDDKDDTKPVSSPNPSTMINKFSPHIRTERLGSVFLKRQYKSFVRPVGFGLSSYRYMSSTPAEWSDKVESVTNQVVPAINEVAIAAVDSPLKEVDVFDNLIASFINDVHSIIGLNWWASIALTSLIISGLTFPMLLYVTKAFRKIDILRPQLEQFRQEMSTVVSDPEAMAKVFQKQKEILFKKHGVNETALISLMVIQAGFFTSFSLTIHDMVKKVPSFKTGGILWFNDLATGDSIFILPLLGGLNIWILWKLVGENAKGMGNLVFVLPLVLASLLNLPNAAHCYWLPSQLFLIVYTLAIRQPSIKKHLNLPELTVFPTPSSWMENKK